MGVCSDNRQKTKKKIENPPSTSKLPEDCILFPKGQIYYQIINDVNIGRANKKSLSKKIELFFLWKMFLIQMIYILFVFQLLIIKKLVI